MLQMVTAEELIHDGQMSLQFEGSASEQVIIFSITDGSTDRFMTAYLGVTPQIMKVHSCIMSTEMMH